MSVPGLLCDNISDNGAQPLNKCVPRSKCLFNDWVILFSSIFHLTHFFSYFVSHRNFFLSTARELIVIN